MEEKSAIQIEFERNLEEYLRFQDWTGAADLIEDQGDQIRSHAIKVPHPIYGKITALEAAIIYDNVGLWMSLRKRFPHSNGLTAANKQGFSHGYLAILHNTSFKEDVLSIEGVFEVAALPLEDRNAFSLPFSSPYERKLPIACAHGHLHVAEFVLQKNPADLERPTAPCSRMPLEIAALYNQSDMCQLLLSYNLQTSTFKHQCDLGNALHIAARFGFDRVVKALLQEPAERSYKSVIDEPEKHCEMTAFGLAATHLHYNAAKELITAGANIDAEQGEKKLTPIQILFTRDCILREECISKDRRARDRLLLLLLQSRAKTEALTSEQLDYIEYLQKSRPTEDVVPEVPSQEVSPNEGLEKEESITLSPSPLKNTPPKKKPLECQLCHKKFTSDVNLSVHLKSKGHLKQIKKRKDSQSSPEAIKQTEKEMRGLIENLPLLSDLLFEVFNRLELIDLRQLYATSKSLKLLIERHGVCWRHLLLWSSQRNKKRVSDWTTNVFEDVMELLPKVKEIIYVQNSHPTSYLYSSLFAIPRECRRLEVLDLRHELTKQFPISFLNHLFENCPNLRVLKMPSIWPYKASKISAVMDGELDVEEQAPVVNPKKPWKVAKTSKPNVADWLVDFNINMPAVAHKLEVLDMTLMFNEPKVTPEQYMEFYIGLFKHWPNIKQLKLTTDEDHAPVDPNVPAHQLYKNVVIGILEVCPNITNLLLDGNFQLGRLSNDEYHQLFRKFGQLEKLELGGEELSNFDRDMSHYLADYGTKITALKIRSSDYMPFIDGHDYPYARMTQLQQFHLVKGEIGPNQRCLHNMLKSCVNITNLRLVIRSTTNELIKDISLYGNRLQSLHLSYNFRLDYTPLAACTALTSLTISGIRTPQLYIITEKCQKLRELTFDCHVPEDYLDHMVQPYIAPEHVLDMGRLLENCTNLTKLEISRAHLTGSSFRHPVVSTSLRVLSNICPWDAFHSDMLLFYLGECCPNLTYLTLDIGLLMTYAVERILTTRLPKLETLYLRAHQAALYSRLFDQVNANRRIKLTT